MLQLLLTSQSGSLPLRHLLHQLSFCLQGPPPPARGSSLSTPWCVSWVRLPVSPAARAMLVWLRLGPQGLGQHMEERALSIYLEDTQQLSRRPGFNSEGPCVNIQMRGPYHELTCKQFFGHSNLIY